MTPDVPNGGRALSAEAITAKGSTASGKRQVGLENQSRIWPTPMVQDANQAGSMGLDMGARTLHRKATLFGRPDPETPPDGGTSSTDGQTLPLLWPTPRTGENGSDSGSKQRLEQGANPGLKDAARNWPSPSASMMTPEDQAQAMFAGNDPRRPKYAEANWPTPRAEMDSGQHRGTPDTLHSASKNWNTPRSHEVGEYNYQTSGKVTPSLTGQAAGLQGKKKLNPRFVCWLMGWPSGWTSLAPISSERQAMESCRWSRHLRWLLSREGRG